MKTLTLHRLARELSERDLDHRALAKEACALIGEYLGEKMMVWITLDPTTLLPTSVHLPGLVFKLAGKMALSFFFKKMAIYDLDPNEPLSVIQLVQAPVGYGSMHKATGGDLSLCRRYREHLAGHGFKDELKVLMEDSGQVWGSFMVGRRSSTFTDKEIEAVGQIGPILGNGLRRSFLRAALISEGGGHARPGLVLFDEDDQIEYVSPEAEALLGKEVPLEPAYWLKTLQLQEEMPVPPVLNVMTVDGAVTIHKTVFRGQQAIMIERSRPDVIAGWLMKAYGLSERESEVVVALCKGLSTKQVGESLSISEWTVQDHLKSIFDKVGVRSRQKLISHLLINHYLPQNRKRATPSPAGWFIE